MLKIAIAALSASVMLGASVAASSASDLDTLVDWMSGSFSSQAQAAADTNYLDVRLEMAPIWLERSDAHWLYVEQAVAGWEEKPYRQRVYRITEIGDGEFLSEVYVIPEPESHVGEWRDEQPLVSLCPADLTVRDGCGVYLTAAEDGTYRGGTRARGCSTTGSGASYATSEVTVSADGIVSWDRGFDSAGVQVWGAESGGYVFLRLPAGEEEER